MKVPNQQGPKEIDEMEVPRHIVQEAIDWYNSLDAKYVMTDEQINIGDKNTIDAWDIHVEFFGHNKDQISFHHPDTGNMVLLTIEEVTELL